MNEQRASRCSGEAMEPRRASAMPSGLGKRQINRDRQTSSLGIDITNLNTTFMCKEDLVALAVRLDADVVLDIIRMRYKWLDEEGLQHTANTADTSLLISAFRNPLLDLGPVSILRSKRPLFPRRLMS